MKKRGKNKKSKNPKELVSYGGFVLSPIVPGPEVDDLCNEIDSFYKNYPTQHKKQKASDLIKGAFYAVRPECRSNPDWMSQAANSLRDVLYPLFSNRISKNNVIKLFSKYIANKNDRSKIQNKEFVRTFINLDKIYKQLSDLTHHGTELKGFSEKGYINFSEKDFNNLLSDFVYVFRRAFKLQQIYIHSLIDLIVQKKSKTQALKQDLKLILGINSDAYQYFYSEVNEQWLKWLWENGFLDAIKKKSEDPTRYGYRTPEINYLVKIAEKNPVRVTDIILATPISRDTFNPEVVDRFLWICSTLPAKQLARLTQKIRAENWVSLLGAFNRWGFEYEKILKTFSDAKDYENVLVMAEAILSLRIGEDAEKIANAFGTEKPFYIEDLSHTKVFDYLLAMPAKYGEFVLDLTISKMAKIVSLGKEEEDKPFSIGDLYYLFDVDFFTLKSGAGRHLSDRDDVRELAAVITTTLRKLIESRCEEKDYVRAVYEKYIGDFDDPKAHIPDSRATWRLRLFALTLCPVAFSDKLKKAFFRLFDAIDHYHDIISGAEYNTALQKAFSALSEPDKRQYVSQVLEFFGKTKENKEDEKWHKIYGSRILSMVAAELNEDEKQKLSGSGLKIDTNYKPESSIGQMHGGTIVSQAPGTEDDWKRPVSEIIKLLKTDWTPAALREKYKDADFLRPIDAEGVAEHLKSEMSLRPGEFISNAQLFFDRKNIDAHYTYAFFQNFYSLVREKKISDGINISPVLETMKSIAESATKEPFEQNISEERKGFGWLANWDAVHSAMADSLKEILGDNSNKPLLDFKTNRGVVLQLITYLLNHPDPGLKDEELETAKFKTKSGGEAEYSIGDPFTTAINSVRGRAFQALINFAYCDSRLMPKEQKVKLSNDVKELYVKILNKENTRAIIFLFGHYLPSLYFWDRYWVKSLLPQIFPITPEKKYLYLSSWEGYLANNLFEEMFFDPEIQKLYERGIALREPEDPKRKHFKDPDEGLAVHLALAFMYYKDFNFDHPLFKSFWENEPKRHSQFVSFLGRAFVSGDNKQANKLLKDDPRAVSRLKDFWDWTLTNISNNDELFSEFGFWINLEKELFETTWLASHVKSVLEKTKGFLDWDYGLTKSLIQLAKEAPADTLAIANLYLLEGGVRNLKPRMLIHIDNEWLAALQTLYDNPATKDGTYTLIDNLIREGGSNFWSLKKILEN